MHDGRKLTFWEEPKTGKNGGAWRQMYAPNNALNDDRELSAFISL